MRDSGEFVPRESIYGWLEALHEVFVKRRHPEGGNYCFLLGAAAKQLGETPEGKAKLSQWMIEAGEKQKIDFTRCWGLHEGGMVIESKRFDEASDVLLSYGRHILEQKGANDEKFMRPLLV